MQDLVLACARARRRACARAAFFRLKPGLALRLLSKGLFYIRAMVTTKEKSLGTNFNHENRMLVIRLELYN